MPLWSLPSSDYRLCHLVWPLVMAEEWCFSGCWEDKKSPLVYLFQKFQWLMSIEACGVAFSSSGLTAILILCLRALFMHPTANDAVLYHFQLFFFSSPSFPHSPSPLSTAPKWESKLKEDIVLPLPIPHLAFASPHLGLHICCPPTILPLLQYDLSS